MAYFPNGTSGEFYQETFCVHCRNWIDAEDGRGYGCPIWDVHLIHNRDRAKNECVKSILDILIPVEGIEALQCSMFHPLSPDRCGEISDLFATT